MCRFNLLLSVVGNLILLYTILICIMSPGRHLSIIPHAFCALSLSLSLSLSLPSLLPPPSSLLPPPSSLLPPLSSLLSPPSSLLPPPSSLLPPPSSLLPPHSIFLIYSAIRWPLHLHWYKPSHWVQPLWSWRTKISSPSHNVHNNAHSGICIHISRYHIIIHVYRFGSKRFLEILADFNLAVSWSAKFTVPARK